MIGAFGVVMVVSAEASGTPRSRPTRARPKGPVAAGLLSLFLLSLAGIPPTAGFVAKVAVFRAATEAGYWPLVLIGVLASVVAAYFYLRVIVLMFMREPGRHPPRRVMAPARTVAVPATLVLVFGVFPGLIVGFSSTRRRCSGGDDPHRSPDDGRVER